MRYPLSFGLITAMIASGLLINFAVENRKHRAEKRQAEQRQTLLSEYHFEGKVVPSGIPNYASPEAKSRFTKLDSISCETENQHSLAITYDQAGLFRQLGWQKQAKSSNQAELIQISTSEARREVLNPVRFASAKQIKNIQSSMWNCGLDFQLPQHWEADLLKAAQMRRKSNNETQIVFNRHSNLEAKFANDSLSIPSDAIESHLDFNPLSIARAELKISDIDNQQQKQKQIFELNSVNFHSLTQQFSSTFVDATDAMKLIENSMPKQENYSGCGSAVVADQLAKSNTPDRLEAEILASVCEINHLSASAIQFDAFPVFPAEAPRTAPTGGIATLVASSAEDLASRLTSVGDLFNQVAARSARRKNDVAKWSAKKFELIEQTISQPVSGYVQTVLDPIESNSLANTLEWNYVFDPELPLFSNSINIWELSESLSQMRPSFDEIDTQLSPIQPIPAANNLGIRAIAKKVHNWFSGEKDQLLNRTVNLSRTFKQWGLQQNEALERMVLQHNDHVQR